jgi:hypothetical protein
MRRRYLVRVTCAGVIQPSANGGTSKQRLGTSRDVFCYRDGVFPLRDGRQETLNESLRRAMLRARLREDDVAAHLGVDPKTTLAERTGALSEQSSGAGRSRWGGRS